MAGKDRDFTGLLAPLKAMIEAEALDMSPTKRQSFLDAMDTHYKAGGYTLSDRVYRARAS
jgi:hypothetical protein